MPSFLLKLVSAFTALSLLVDLGMGLGCSWSNEGCNHDEECCSNSCHQAHEGTNSRCRHSSLGERCVFDYHCQDGLTCGAHYNCCSPYWKMCTKKSDCCSEDHVCRSAEGYYYERCLYPSGAPRLARTGTSLATQISLSLAVTFFMGWRFPLGAVFEGSCFS